MVAAARPGRRPARRAGHARLLATARSPRPRRASRPSPCSASSSRRPASIPYDQLVPRRSPRQVQALPRPRRREPEPRAGPIARRDVTYTVAVGVCSSTTRPTAPARARPASFCASPRHRHRRDQCRDLSARRSVQGTANAVAAARRPAGVGDCGIDLNLDGTVDQLVGGRRRQRLHRGDPAATARDADSNPDDYKRIVSLVTWDRGDGRRYALQSTTRPEPRPLRGRPRSPR